MKTSELTGPALDYMVHVALGHSMHSCAYWLEKYADEQRRDMCEAYSTSWSYGGPIIEREWLDVTPWPNESDESVRWQCTQHYLREPVTTLGPTPLIAAMRCFCVSKLGETVEVPEELA